MGIDWRKRAEENVVGNIEQMQVSSHILGRGLTKLVVLSEVSVRQKANHCQI